MNQNNNYNVAKTRQKVIAIVLIATIAVIAIAGVLALIYTNNTNGNNNKNPRLEDEINQPVSTIDLHQWLQDNPNDKIRSSDLGSSNTKAIKQEDNTTKIFSNTSFTNLNKIYPNTNSAVLDFYLALNEYSAGIYRYSFRIVFDNADATNQSYALCTILIQKVNNDNFAAYLLYRDYSDNGRTKQKTLNINSINNKISIKFDVQFADSKTKINIGVHDSTAKLEETRINDTFHNYVSDDSTNNYPASIRSIAYASTTPHGSNNNASAIDRQAPHIDVRSLQLLSINQPK